MAEIDEKLAELEGFSDYIREYQVSPNWINIVHSSYDLITIELLLRRIDQ